VDAFSSNSIPFFARLYSMKGFFSAGITLKNLPLLTSTDGHLSEDVEKLVSISTSNAITRVPDPADPTFNLTVAPLTGTITGAFLHTADDLPNLTPFQGIILQKGPDAGAYGFFKTKAPAVIDYTGESGGVSLIGQP